jgi:hypothetical protein
MLGPVDRHDRRPFNGQHQSLDELDAASAGRILCHVGQEGVEDMLYLELPTAALHLGDQVTVPFTDRAAADRQLRQGDSCRRHSGSVVGRSHTPRESTQLENAARDAQPSRSRRGIAAPSRCE